MKHKAIFLDRDGTLVVDPGYVHKIGDFKFHEGVIEALKLLKDIKLFIITNQSGIGRGYYTEEDMHKFNNYMLSILNKNGIRIERIYFCPHVPDEECECRKPNTRFIKEAVKEFDIDLKDSYVIGDDDLDVQLGKNVCCKTIYLLTGHGRRHLESARGLKPDYVAATLRQAVTYIKFENDKKIIPKEEIGDLADKLRKKKKIVTINGTFDILHKGHEYILKEAKNKGDVLIVGINSDTSVKQNKGPERPINDESSRAKMIASFQVVDYATIFDEQTPIRLLEIIKPDIHVNGSEYGENCIEAEIVKRNGGKIHIVNLMEEFSTTSIISNSE